MSDPDHEAAIRFSGEAPRWRSHRSNETFVAFTFVDGVMTEFEDLGRMPDDASFQGR
jgi:hypothetical protein